MTCGARRSFHVKRVGLASPDNSDTQLGTARRAHVRRTVLRRGRAAGAAAAEARHTTMTAPAEDHGEDRSQRSYKLHSGGSWTGSGAARARTRRAGVYALLDWDNLPDRATRLLRLE